MFQSLRLRNFKNFRDAELKLGPFTVLVGANASGKSNIRDALRFLHGLGLGYELTEVLGEAYRGGTKVWSGIRGGVRGAAFTGEEKFGLRASIRREEGAPQAQNIDYHVDISIQNRIGAIPLVDHEFVEETMGASRLRMLVDRMGEKSTTGRVTLDSSNSITNFSSSSEFQTTCEKSSLPIFSRDRSFLHLENVAPHVDESSRLNGDSSVDRTPRSIEPYEFLNEIYTFDLLVGLLREPSAPGASQVGSQGEFLSSRLFAISESPDERRALLDWLRRLTPMDVQDFDFDSDAAGRVLVRLVEDDGRSISALSASDGTLRFLATLVALMSAKPDSLIFLGVCPSIHLWSP